MNRRKFDVAFASMMIIVALVILTNDSLVEGGVQTELGSMFLPRIVAVFIILFSAQIAVPSLLKLLKGTALGGLERIDGSGFAGVALYLAILFGYWFAIPHVGFLVATPVAMFVIGWLLGGRSWLAMAAVSTLTPLAIHYGSSMFLRVFLPTWSLS